MSKLSMKCEHYALDLGVDILHHVKENFNCMYG